MFDMTFDPVKMQWQLGDTFISHEVAEEMKENPAERQAYIRSCYDYQDMHDPHCYRYFDLTRTRTI